MSLNVGDTMYMGDNLRAEARAFITKFPYNYFSAFPTIYAIGPTFLVSEDDFNTMLYNNIWWPNPDAWETF